jgi:hypothetical protein
MRFGIAVVTASALCAQGCSIAFTTPAPTVQPPRYADPGDCEASRAPAVADVLGGLVLIVGGGFFAFANQINDYPEQKYTVAALLVAAAGVGLEVSAAKGFSRSRRCRELKAAALAEAPPPVDEGTAPPSVLAKRIDKREAIKRASVQQAHVTATLLGLEARGKVGGGGEVELGSSLASTVEMSAFARVVSGDGLGTDGLFGARLVFTLLPRAPVRPFLLGVLGYSTDQEFVGEAGLGVRIPLPTRILLEVQLDARWSNFGDYPIGGLGLRYDWDW